MQWKVLVMGLRNAGSQFQRMMEGVFKDLSHVDPYLDGIIVGSVGDSLEQMIENHRRDLEKVMKVLEENKLVARSAKSTLFQRDFGFCGHILRDGIRQPFPCKFLPAKKLELRKTVTALRGFLG